MVLQEYNRLGLEKYKSDVAELCLKSYIKRKCASGLQQCS